MVLRAAVRGLDTLLRLRYGVHEFSRSPGCIFRVGPAHSPADMHLADGLVVRRGEPIADLHLWNEHIPPLPPEGADMRWAVGFYRLMRSSLQELADYLETEPRYRTAAAVRAVGSVMAKAPGRSSAGGGGPRPPAPLEEFAARLGFEVLDPHGNRPPSRWRRFAEAWDNGFNLVLVWVYNPPSLRTRGLGGLRRVQLWMSRERFLARYGKRAAKPYPTSRECTSTNPQKRPSG